MTPGDEVTLLAVRCRAPTGSPSRPTSARLRGEPDPGRAVWMAFPVLEDGTLGRAGSCSTRRTSSPISRPPRRTRGGRRGAPLRDGSRWRPGPHPRRPVPRHDLTGQPTNNCTFGGDGRTLYVTADESLLRVRLSTTGSEVSPSEGPEARSAGALRRGLGAPASRAARQGLEELDLDAVRGWSRVRPCPGASLEVPCVAGEDADEASELGTCVSGACMNSPAAPECFTCPAWTN